MRQNSKFILIFVSVLLFVSTFAYQEISAHPVRGDSQLSYWNHSYYDDYYGHDVLTFNVNGSHLNSYWSQHMSYMVYNWNNYSNNYVSMTFTDFYNSNLDYFNPTLWPSGLPNDVYAACYCVDANNVYLHGYGTDIFNSNCSTYITYAQIICNAAYNGATSMNIRKTLVHEAGHAMQFGHESYPTESVLRPGHENDLEWYPYDIPQAHDRTELSQRY